VTQRMKQQLAQAGAKVDAVYYCAHASSENCTCRKPKTGMLDCAAREHAVELQRSFVVGDRYIDIELARNARARGILVRTGYGEGELAWHAVKWCPAGFRRRGFDASRRLDCEAAAMKRAPATEQPPASVDLRDLAECVEKFS